MSFRPAGCQRKSCQRNLAKLLTKGFPLNK